MSGAEIWDMNSYACCNSQCWRVWDPNLSSPELCSAANRHTASDGRVGCSFPLFSKLHFNFSLDLLPVHFHLSTSRNDRNIITLQHKTHTIKPYRRDKVSVRTVKHLNSAPDMNILPQSTAGISCWFPVFRSPAGTSVCERAPCPRGFCTSPPTPEPCEERHTWDTTHTRSGRVSRRHTPVPVVEVDVDLDGVINEVGLQESGLGLLHVPAEEQDVS